MMAKINKYKTEKKEKKKKKSNHAAAINYSTASSARVRQGFVEGSVEGSRKEEENKEISEKASAIEEQNQCFSEKDIAFDENLLQEVKHVQKINDLTLSFEDKSEVEKNFELKTDEKDLTINDSFKPFADDLEKTAEGSRKEAENKAMEEENRYIWEIDRAIEDILPGVKHANKVNDLTVSFENKSEVEKNFELKIGEMDLKTNDSVKSIAAGMGTIRLANIEDASNEIFLKGKVNDSIASLEVTVRNEGLGEALEKDMSEVVKSSEVKINDASKPFVDDPEKSEDLAEDFSQFETRSEDLAEDFSQFETKIKERRSELAFEEKKKFLPCNLLEVLVPASENRCMEEKDEASTENFTEDVKQESVNPTISLFEDIERYKIEKIIDFLKAFLDNVMIKILAKIGDLDEKFVRFEKKMIEMEECFELKTGKMNALINDQSMFFASELQSIKLSLENRGAKREDEKMEMEKSFQKLN